MSGPFRSPADLLAELCVTRPEEIDIEAIAQYCGATVIYGPLRGCEARLLGYGDEAIITVREDSPEGRRRFSAAHELGHWMRDRERVASFSCSGSAFREWSPGNPETRANRYAAELLMPEALFRGDAAGGAMTFETVRGLAGRYGTSLAAAAIRLLRLGSYPAMLVAHLPKASRWSWFLRGPDLPAVLWPLDRPGDGSLASRLLEGSGPVVSPMAVPADSWIEHPEAGRYWLMEDTVSSGGLLLSLLWWEDQSQLLDLMAVD